MKTLLRFSENQIHRLYVLMVRWKNTIQLNAKYSGAVDTAKNLEFVNGLNDKITWGCANHNGANEHAVELTFEEIKYISNVLETWNSEIKHQFNMGLLDFDTYEHDQQLCYQLLIKVYSILL